MRWCWKENDICTASFAMANSTGNLSEPDASESII